MTDPKILTAVNLDITRAADGEIACLLGLIDEEGQTDYLMSREGVESVMQALTNYIDIIEGRQPTHPSAPRN